MREPELLFVYGTLLPGASGGAARLLLGRAAPRGTAHVRGELYRIGEYPGLVLGDPAGARVPGALYELADAEAVLAALDAYEGCGPDDPPPHDFERVRAEAVLESGERVMAWVYVYRGRVDPTRRIGEWKHPTP